MGPFSANCDRPRTAKSNGMDSSSLRHPECQTEGANPGLSEEERNKGTATLIAIAGLIVNIVSALLLGHGHSHGHDHVDHGHTHAHHGNDNNLKSAYVHVIADALTSVLAIAALLAGRYLGWVWLDPVMGIVGAIVIARWAWTLMGVTAGVLLDQTDAHVAEEIRELVEKPGDATITDLHVWRVGPQAHAAIVSVLDESSANADSIRERLKPVHEVSHLTVEFRPA